MLQAKSSIGKSQRDARTVVLTVVVVDVARVLLLDPSKFVSMHAPDNGAETPSDDRFRSDCSKATE